MAIIINTLPRSEVEERLRHFQFGSVVFWLQGKCGRPKALGLGRHFRFGSVTLPKGKLSSITEKHSNTVIAACAKLKVGCSVLARARIPGNNDSPDLHKKGEHEVIQ